MAAMNEILDLIEAADYLRVKPATIYAWVHQRKIPYRKHGRKLVFLRKDLEIWSARKQVEPLECFPKCFHATNGESHSSLKTRCTVDEGPSL